MSIGLVVGDGIAFLFEEGGTRSVTEGVSTSLELAMIKTQAGGDFATRFAVCEYQFNWSDNTLQDTATVYHGRSCE